MSLNRKVINRPREDRRSQGRLPSPWANDIRLIEHNWMQLAQQRSSWRRMEEAYIQH
ncbi:hypothetical protein HUJ05_001974 [Dendroctonus ponderosae]|nr:hypothetical protein HUJ05_001974 [Dendroctonus ponderosae]